MAEIDVTVEALSRVRMALKKFQIDTECFPNDVRNHISKLKEDCDWEMSNVKQKLKELTDRKNEIRKQIDTKKKRCDDFKRERDRCREKKEQYNSEYIRGMFERSALERELKSRRDAIEKEIQSQIWEYGCIIDEKTDSQIAMIEYEIRCLDKSISSYKQWMSEQERSIDECNNEIKRLTSEIQQAEDELHNVKREWSRIEDKYSRLKNAYLNLMREADNFSAAVNKFCRRALDATEGNISGINQSIKFVEEYMTTNL